MGKKKHRTSEEAPPAELNIMPFIDIFSMLNTFLLVSAAFVNIGLIEVQIPFLTNASPPKEKPSRSLSVKVGIEKDKIELETSWDAPPIELTKTEFSHSEADLTKLHRDLVALREKHPKTDKVDVFTEDDVKYDKMVKVLDTIMVRVESDPIFKEPDPNGVERESDFIYRKVIMAGVIL